MTGIASGRSCLWAYVGLVVSLLAGCSEPQAASVPADWVAVTSTCGYSFMGPPDILAEEIQGIDSCVDQWSTGSCSLSGDFGAYSGRDVETPGMLEFQQWSETIDGRRAQLTTYSSQFGEAGRQFVSSVYFGGWVVNGWDVSLRVSAFCPNPATQDETLLLYRSITFQGEFGGDLGPLDD